jgi:hypothetical protein
MEEDAVFTNVYPSSPSARPLTINQCFLNIRLFHADIITDERHGRGKSFDIIPRGLYSIAFNKRYFREGT